jgi:hypothetical protein
VDLSQVHSQSVALLYQVADEKLLTDTRELLKEIQSEDLPAVPVQYFLEADETTLTILPESELKKGTYHLVVTPLLRSAEGLPFNQEPGENPTAFVAKFFVGAAGENPGNPDLPPADPEFGPEPDFLVINEVLYDGRTSETDGEAFVELYGTPGTDISLYQVHFINGADGAAIDRVTLPHGTLLPQDGIFVIADLQTKSSTASRVAAADFLDNFDPQNGPDGLLLLNRAGELLDTLVYGAGAVTQAAGGLELGEGFPAVDVGNGHSLSRVGGQDTQDNAMDYVDSTLPTPGWL